MTTLDLLKDLFRHMEWADATVLASAKDTGDAPPDAAMLKTLTHIHSTQYAFLKAWQNESIDWSQLKTLQTIASLETWARGFYEPAGEFLESLSDGDLGKALEMPWAKRFAKAALGADPVATTTGETVYQVAAHSNYHRGQVNRRIREVGGKPPTVDHIAWVWMGRPSAPWD